MLHKNVRKISFITLQSPRIPSDIDDITDSSISIPINCTSSNNIIICDLPKPELVVSSGNWICKNVVKSVSIT